MTLTKAQKQRVGLGAFILLIGLLWVLTAGAVGIVLIVCGLVIAGLGLAGFASPQDAFRGRRID